MPTTTTTISRSKLAQPDLGHDGGALLHSRITTLREKLGDQANSRYQEYTGIANGGVVELDHNFGANLDEIEVLIYSGSGATKQQILDPKSTANGYAVAEKAGSEELIIEITAPASGGPHSFTVIALEGRQTEAKHHQLLESAPSTPAAGVIKTFWDSNKRGLTKDSLGVIGTQQTLTPVHVSSSTFNALPGFHYICDTTSNAIIATLPANIADHDVMQFSDAKKTFNTNNLTLARNGNNIDSEAADLVFNTPGDGALLVGDNTASNWVRASSGGAGGSGEAGINYFENGSFENDATTGVSATNITAAAEEASPLIGARSSKLTSTASVGTVDYAISGIDNHIIDGGYKLTVYGRYKTDSAISLGDFTVGIYNSTDAAYADGPNSLAVDVNGRFELGFVPLTGKTYVLRVEFTDTTAGRILLIDDLKCSNDPLPESPIIGAVQTTSPTYNSESGITWARNNLTYARVGDSLHVNGLVYVSNGSGVAADFTLPLPTINGESITATAGNFGEATLIWGNNDDITGYLTGDGTSNVKFTFGGTVLQGSDFGTPGGGSQEGMRYSAMIPISQWAAQGTSVLVSDTTKRTKWVDTSVQALTYNTSWTPSTSLFQAYADSNGQWFIRGYLEYVAQTAVSSQFINLTGLSIKGGMQVPILWRFFPSTWPDTAAQTLTNAPGSFAYANSAGGLRLNPGQGMNSTTESFLWFDIPLASKPSWADAHMENQKDVSVHILEATSSTPGLVYKPQILYKVHNADITTSTTNLLQITSLPIGRYRLVIGARGFYSHNTGSGEAIVRPRLNDVTINDAAGQTVDAGLFDATTITQARLSRTILFTNSVASNTFDIDVSISGSGSVDRPYYILERISDSHEEITTEWD